MLYINTGGSEELHGVFASAYNTDSTVEITGVITYYHPRDYMPYAVLYRFSSMIDNDTNWSMYTSNL